MLCLTRYWTRNNFVKWTKILGFHMYKWILRSGQAGRTFASMTVVLETFTVINGCVERAVKLADNFKQEEQNSFSFRPSQSTWRITPHTKKASLIQQYRAGWLVCAQPLNDCWFSQDCSWFIALWQKCNKLSIMRIIFGYFDFSKPLEAFKYLYL